MEEKEKPEGQAHNQVLIATSHQCIYKKFRWLPDKDCNASQFS